jgi:putative flippase GtrA
MIEKFTKHLIVRYIISGGTSASVNLLGFSLFFFIFHIHYIVSNVIAFIIAFGVSLVLQKFWTFRDHSTDNIHIQGLLYLFNSLFGLSVNTLVLYICVHFLGILPIIGVIIAGISTALCTFPISRKYVFNQGAKEIQ